MIRSSVDLPEPLGPSSAVSEPSGTSSETSSRATKSPKRFDTFDDGDHAAPASFQQGHQDQGHEREAHQHGRRRVGAEGVVVVDVAGVDEQRERLRLAGDAAGDDGQRAELAERAGDRQHDAVGRRRPRIAGQRDAPERLPARGAERRGGLLLLGADLVQHRLDLAHDERQRHERSSRAPCPGSEKITGAGLGEPAEPAAVAPEAGSARRRRSPARPRTAGRRPPAAMPAPAEVARARARAP